MERLYKGLGRKTTLLCAIAIGAVIAVSILALAGCDNGTNSDSGRNTGGNNTGEDNTGGNNTGGNNTGGNNTGGNNTGGNNTGGDNTGGDNTGGNNTGGDNTGGNNTGGNNTGGNNTGGDNTGGDNTGGNNTGGDNTGGNNTGGDNTGGNNTGGGGTTVPKAPTGVKATAQSSSSISVSWNSVSGATSYKIYRGVSSTWTPSETTVTGTSYTFTELDAATTYYFRITAINSSGESSQSTAASAKTESAPLAKPNTPYGSPVIKSASTTKSSLTIEWAGSLGATGYKLYRSTSSSGPFTVVYTGSSTTYTNTGLSAETTYYYQVTATNSAGESDPTEVGSGTTKS